MLSDVISNNSKVQIRWLQPRLDWREVETLCKELSTPALIMIFESVSEEWGHWDETLADCAKGELTTRSVLVPGESGSLIYNEYKLDEDVEGFGGDVKVRELIAANIPDFIEFIEPKPETEPVREVVANSLPDYSDSVKSGPAEPEVRADKIADLLQAFVRKEACYLTELWKFLYPETVESGTPDFVRILENYSVDVVDRVVSALVQRPKEDSPERLEGILWGMLTAATYTTK